MSSVDLLLSKKNETLLYHYYYYWKIFFIVPHHLVIDYFYCKCTPLFFFLLTKFYKMKISRILFILKHFYYVLFTFAYRLFVCTQYQGALCSQHLQIPPRLSHNLYINMPRVVLLIRLDSRRLKREKADLSFSSLGSVCMTTSVLRV